MYRNLLPLFLLVACSSTAAPTPAGTQPGGTATLTTAATAAAAEQQAPRAAVASVVILEMKDCCACTDKRQKDSRAAFDAEVAKRPAKPPITVVYVDTEPEKAREYRDMQEPVTTPAYYLLDAAGLMVTFLQGEVTGAQFAQALGAP